MTMQPRLITTEATQGPVRNSFFDYYKTILEKVSFDRALFNKEYRKAIQILSPDETAALDRWIASKNLNTSVLMD